MLIDVQLLKVNLFQVNLAYENVKEVDCLDISREGCDAWEAAVRRYEDRIGTFQGIF